MGDFLSTAVSLLDLDVVVIGGDIAQAHEPFLLGLRHILLTRSQPSHRALDHRPIVLADRASVTGADAIFSTSAVDAVLG